MSGIKYYWEDLQPGTVRELGSVSPTAEEIKAFAAQFDPQPFHLDEEAGRRSLFGGLCASGWHTCSMAMGLLVRNFLGEVASLGSPGLDKIRWLKPVYPGDTLSLRFTVLESRPMNSRPDTGLAKGRQEMFNQYGEKVLEMEGYGMYRRRRPAGAAESSQQPDAPGTN
jgi:acyl dehydratase